MDYGYQGEQNIGRTARDWVPLRKGEPLIQEWRETNPTQLWGPYWESTNVGILYWAEGSYLLVKVARTVNGGETWERIEALGKERRNRTLAELSLATMALNESGHKLKVWRDTLRLYTGVSCTRCKKMSGITDELMSRKDSPVKVWEEILKKMGSCLTLKGVPDELG